MAFLQPFHRATLETEGDNATIDRILLTMDVSSIQRELSECIARLRDISNQKDLLIQNSPSSANISTDGFVSKSFSRFFFLESYDCFNSAMSADSSVVLSSETSLFP
jgi:hypothetical protein